MSTSLACVDAPCLPTCPAHGFPTTREHAPDCRWRPMASFQTEPERRLASAIEQARAERAALGKASNGHG